ncbi:YD repeat-containing protein [Kordia periserrulae]|uniref:YD repeat-containing protein n=1 Tax=Kordia periserrulae TaxID=701523 RepID=A0A2T6BWJ2_9FLAO|nr:hypothetical protein [Kordia periserrulae]PTX60433.1 YD repeat-containing protein [Kordia periserrulae]
MKKLIALCFLFAFIVSCSSNDDIVAQEEQNTETPVQEPVNTILRPSKISKMDSYWVYEYEGNRVTKIEEFDVDNTNPQEVYEFNYDSSNNLISVLRNFNDDLGFIFENGIATRNLILPFSWNSSYENTRDYTYNNQTQLTSSVNSLWFTDYNTSLWNETHEKQYTYDANGNLLEKEYISTNVNYSTKYIYDDKNHPFKYIDPRVNLFLKLPNALTPNDTYVDLEIFSSLDEIQSFNNNIIEFRNANNVLLGEYTIIYNEHDYPIEIHPGNGSISRRIYIEYEEFPE